MARRSILTPARDDQRSTVANEVPSHQAPREQARRPAPSRVDKLHIGGYFDPADPTIIAFQKLKIDLRRSQQDMLLEAVRDFVAKHKAAQAFQK